MALLEFSCKTLEIKRSLSHTDVKILVVLDFHVLILGILVSIPDVYLPTKDKIRPRTKTWTFAMTIRTRMTDSKIQDGEDVLGSWSLFTTATAWYQIKNSFHLYFLCALLDTHKSLYSYFNSSLAFNSNSAEPELRGPLLKSLKYG